ncbi:hypothetical protein AB1484_06540 [Parafrankia sp. FMc6]|uniref:hypothetical protein n=1 Tax=Parafrankia soli TaxID=2599596 RepID=UPI0034D7AA3E
MNVAEDGPLGPDLIGSGGSAGPERPFLSPVRRRAGDLALGVRLAVAGGRSERLRMTLSAVGVGVGVALLLVATAIPSLLENLSDRRTARDLPGSFFGTGYPGTHGLVATDTTMIVERYMGGFRDIPLMGVLLDPEGTHPPLPPGITTLPGPGEMIVSPALAELLAGRDRPRLVPRLPYRQVGRIGKAGLESPRELFFYAGVELSAELSPEGDTFEVFGPERIDHFGAEPTARIYVLVGTLSLLVVVVLLLPIGMFAAAAAVRFGSEARDRQLAVVRLLGADARTARWIAAGGALAAALLG